MIINDFSDIGQITNTGVNGGRLQDKNTNMGYKTPYQFPYEGMLVSLKLSSTYDAAAVPTVRVATPATTGVLVSGWAFNNTFKQHPLPGAPDTLFPLNANLSATDSNSIPYSGSIANWTGLTVAPLMPGELIGIPIAPGCTFVVGDEVSAFNGGYATVAVSGSYVIGMVEKVGSATTQTSMWPPYSALPRYVAVRPVGTQYKKV
jgi:hypothetical protein